MRRGFPRARVALGCCFCIYACGGTTGSSAGGESGAGDSGDAGAGGRTEPGTAGEAGRGNAAEGGLPSGGTSGVDAGQAGDLAGGGIAHAGAGLAGMASGGIAAGGGSGAGGPGGVGGAGGAGGVAGSDPGVASLPATCRDIPTELPDGDYLIDPNSGDAGDAFTVTCDLTSDGGGWTLIGRGQWWTAEADALVAGIDAYLPAVKRGAIVQASSSLFRAGDGAQRLFIRDSNALLESGFHYWRTVGSSVACTTDYADVNAGTMAITTSIGISCDVLAVGSHTCGTLNGWILFHLNDPYNVSGAHPCSLGAGDRPTEAGLRTLWVR